MDRSWSNAIYLHLLILGDSDNCTDAADSDVRVEVEISIIIGYLNSLKGTNNNYFINET